MSEKKPDPIRKSVAELETDGYVDRMIAEYEPVKKKTGDYYKFTLEYITNEDTYMTSETEKEFISEYGLAPIGLLEILRMHMCRKNGFGICTTNKDLQKVFFEIKGFAFFFHCFRVNRTYTGGCVGVPENIMKFIMQHIKPGCKITIDSLKNMKGDLDA